MVLQAVVDRARSSGQLFVRVYLPNGLTRTFAASPHSRFAAGQTVDVTPEETMAAVRRSRRSSLDVVEVESWEENRELDAMVVP